MGVVVGIQDLMLFVEVCCFDTVLTKDLHGRIERTIVLDKRVSLVYQHTEVVNRKFPSDEPNHPLQYQSSVMILGA